MPPMSKQYAQKWRDKNRNKLRALQRKWCKDNPKKVQAKWLKQHTGCSLDQWHSMLVAQAGRCAVCNEPMKVPVVEHCHETGIIRGLCHGTCNSMLGMARDNPSLLRAGADYLERFFASRN